MHFFLKRNRPGNCLHGESSLPAQSPGPRAGLGLDERPGGERVPTAPPAHPRVPALCVHQHQAGRCTTLSSCGQGPCPVHAACHPQGLSTGPLRGRPLRATSGKDRGPHPTLWCLWTACSEGVSAAGKDGALASWTGSRPEAGSGPIGHGHPRRPAREVLTSAAGRRPSLRTSGPRAQQRRVRNE